MIKVLCRSCNEQAFGSMDVGVPGVGAGKVVTCKICDTEGRVVITSGTDARVTVDGPFYLGND